MDYRLMSLEIGAILISYMVFMLPIAGATNVNILFNGQVQQTVQLEPETIVNKEIYTEHDPSDITWSNVKVRVKINKASLAHTIKKIYLYKCKKMDPVQCVLSVPQSFDQWTDTELAWSDISEREGVATYPQVANLLLLVKLEDINARITWTGFWVVVKRFDYNVFDVHDEIELDQLDLHAESLEMVEPILFFIESYRMVPFNWLTKAVFRATSALYAIGADGSELEQSPPVFEAGKPPGNEITLINKDYYFILPNTTSGVAHPVPLNLNPSFVCGDNFCQSDLGETKSNCCYDCFCPEEQYCDLSNATPKQGTCKNESLINLEVTGYSVPQLSDCSGQYTINITARVNNAPSTLPSSIQGYLTINNTFYTISCSGGAGGIYSCPLTLTPAVRCGSGSYSLGPNVLNSTISYMDGPNSVTGDLSTAFPDMSISYDCACSLGYYCEAGSKTCQPEGSISLSIISVSSYITYNATDNKIKVRARVNNPPADLGVTGSTYVLGNITYDSAFVSGSLPGASGSVTCSLVPNETHVYDCLLPFTIPSYNHSYRYVIRDNSLTFSVSYSNGALTVNRDLTSIFSDITIPSWHCGDGTCNPEENSATCCLDCACLLPGQYCDSLQGCLYATNTTLAIDAVNPKNVTDCKMPHIINITARIVNPPTNLALNYYYYIQDNEIKGWNLQCTEASPGMNLGIFNCYLTIPPIEDCSLPYYTVGPNKLNFTITYLNGTEGQIVKTLQTDFDNIYITPIYHCGQYGCESEFGESGANCCIDCPCEDDPGFGSGYYCDYDPQLSPSGTCLAKSNITLVIDSPTAPVHFQSCEVPNNVNIKAHIESQPSGMFVESAFAILNDTTTNVWCKREQLFPGANHSYNCTIRISPIFECTQGSTYNYENNSMSLFISYTNGIGRREAQALTASFPEVVITQGIRTLYDIMQDAREKLLQKVDETMGIAQEFLKWIEFCVQMIFAFAIISMVAMIVVPIGAHLKEGGATWDEALGATGVAALAINKIWANICQMVSEWYSVQLDMKAMEMELIKMEWCTEFWQHQMDIGYCRGDEWNCFSSIVNCVDFGELKTYMRDATDSVRRMGGYMGRIGENLQEVGEAIAETWGTGRGTLVISVNGRSISSGENVCEYNGPIYKTVAEVGVQIESCKDRKIKIIVPSSKYISCNRYLVALDGDPVDVREHDAEDLLGREYGDHTFSLYCDREPYGTLDSRDRKVEGDIMFTYMKANPRTHTPESEACWCTGMGMDGMDGMKPMEHAMFPTAPKSFAGTYDETKKEVSLSWGHVMQATGYDIYGCNMGMMDLTTCHPIEHTVTSGTTTSATIDVSQKPLQSGVSAYKFIIRAKKDTEAGEWSSVREVGEETPATQTLQSGALTGSYKLDATLTKPSAIQGSVNVELTHTGNSLTGTVGGVSITGTVSGNRITTNPSGQFELNGYNVKDIAFSGITSDNGQTITGTITGKVNTLGWRDLEGTFIARKGVGGAPPAAGGAPTTRQVTFSVLVKPSCMTLQNANVMIHDVDDNNKRLASSSEFTLDGDNGFFSITADVPTGHTNIKAMVADGATCTMGKQHNSETKTITIQDGQTVAGFGTIELTGK